MQISQSNKEGLIYKFKVVITSDQVNQKVSERLLEITKKVKIPGFRPGKAPLSLLKQRYIGEATEKTVNKFVNQAIDSILKENPLKQVKQPSVEIDQFDMDTDLAFTVTIETLPIIDIKPFEEINLEKLVPILDQQEIDTFLNAQLKDAVNYIDAGENYAASLSDLVHVVVSPIVKGKVVAKKQKDMKIELKNSSENEESNISQLLEKELLGKKVGDNIHINPLSNSGDSAKSSEIEVVIKKIQTPSKFSAIDESFAKHLGYESVDVLKAETQKKVNDYYVWASRFRLKRHLLDALSEKYSFDIPSSMVEAEFKDIWARLQSELEEAKKTGNLDPEDDKPEDELKAEYMSISERRVRLGLLISEISNLNKISLTKEEIAQAVFKDALNYPAQMNEVIDFYKKTPRAVEQLVAPLLEDKVIDFILKTVSITEKEVDIPTLKAEVSQVIPGFFPEEESSSQDIQASEKETKQTEKKKNSTSQESLQEPSSDLKQQKSKKSKG